MDATNYVMLEIGHPMHAHDKARISGDFRVRFATPGETVITLDDVQRKLEPGDVLIADDAGVTAIGGVMGAGSTEMREDSTDVRAFRGSRDIRCRAGSLCVSTA
ncbi:Phenylalanyl-tRNA synthetase beta chain PheT [Mycobacteroides abscessus subsp. massiliense]|nr:Phenylalanyl-tRNA synthetase beta chain PheT [Mycobacteroides abscessus subsp. massiliense]